jgi:hypothetical protein
MSQPTSNPFIEFLNKYKNDPVLFCQNVLGVEPDDWQKELMIAIADGERKISVRSAHGVGKSSVASWIMLHTLLTNYDCKVIVTAPTSSQLFDALFAELSRWIKEMPQSLQDLVDVKSDRVVLKARPNEVFISARTSRRETPEALAGVHSTGKVMLVVDEASGVPEEVFESAAGSMSGDNVHTILLGNPTRNSGLFYDTHHRLSGSWHTFHISAYDSPRVSKEFIEEMAMRYGEDSPAFSVRVKGDFAEESDDGVISLDLIESAVNRDVPMDNSHDTYWALDVARHGSDSSVLVKRRGNVIFDIKTFKKLNLMELTGRVMAEFDSVEPHNRPIEIYIDAIGLGYGVIDAINEIGRLSAVAINVAESASMSGTYMNLRAELWFKFKAFLEEGLCKLPKHETMTADLLSAKYKFTAAGKIQLESKEQTKKRLGRSPDVADALVLLMAGDLVAVKRSSSWQRNWKEPLIRSVKGVV